MCGRQTTKCWGRISSNFTQCIGLRCSWPRGYKYLTKFYSPHLAPEKVVDPCPLDDRWLQNVQESWERRITWFVALFSEHKDSIIDTFGLDPVRYFLLSEG